MVQGHTINSGRCFVLVGSGPSCEVGFPSWQKLAEQTYSELTRIGRVSDTKSYEQYLASKKYPELFRQAEHDFGDRIALINLIKPLLYSSSKNHGVLYELISKWPFACYLTTNYDDEISHYLADAGAGPLVPADDFHALLCVDSKVNAQGRFGIPEFGAWKRGGRSAGEAPWWWKGHPAI